MSVSKKVSYEERVLNRLQGGSKENIVQFKEEFVEFINEQIDIRYKELKKIETKIAECDARLAEVTEKIDLGQIGTIDERTVYIKAVYEKMVTVLTSLQSLNINRDKNKFELSNFEKQLAAFN